MLDRKQANQKVLNETTQIQNQSKDAILRMQRKGAEAEALGAQTLEELRRQGQQIVSLHSSNKT